MTHYGVRQYHPLLQMEALTILTLDIQQVQSSIRKQSRTHRQCLCPLNVETMQGHSTLLFARILISRTSAVILMPWLMVLISLITPLSWDEGVKIRTNNMSMTRMNEEEPILSYSKQCNSSELEAEFSLEELGVSTRDESQGLASLIPSVWHQRG